jgi:hypothetical protein
MSTQTQPQERSSVEALRLAEQLRDLSTRFKTPSHEKGVCNGASFELRRLHEANQELLEALNLTYTATLHIQSQLSEGKPVQAENEAAISAHISRAAIAKAIRNN